MILRENEEKESNAKIKQQTLVIVVFEGQVYTVCVCVCEKQFWDIWNLIFFVRISKIKYSSKNKYKIVKSKIKRNRKYKDWLFLWNEINWCISMKLTKTIKRVTKGENIKN